MYLHMSTFPVSPEIPKDLSSAYGLCFDGVSCLRMVMGFVHGGVVLAPIPVCL
jgi:hypothetical protein